MKSYNLYLYEKRTEMGLSRRKFAKGIKCWSHIYRMMENGYLKPGKKLTAKISEFIGEDFSPYTIGDATYGTDIPQKKPGKLVTKFYNFLGSFGFRLVMCLLFVTGLVLIPSAFVFKSVTADKRHDFYDPIVWEVRDKIRENGSFTMSTKKSLLRYEVYKQEGDEKFVSIKVDSDDSKISKMDFIAHCWVDGGRIDYTFQTVPELMILDADYYDYELCMRYIVPGLYVVPDDGESQEGEQVEFTFFAVNADYPELSTNEKDLEVQTLVKEKSEGLYEIWKELLKDKAGVDVTPYKLSLMLADGQSRQSKNTATHYILLFVGLFFALGGGFGWFYSFTYGTKNGIGRDFGYRGNLITHPKRTEMKSDIKFTPFISETLLEIIGIVVLFISSVRILIMFLSYAGGLQYSSETLSETNNIYMSLFYIGMFLLYFLDFDMFMEDNRVIRNVIMYFCVYLFLYTVEAVVLTNLTNSTVAIYQFLAGINVPNMFGSICMYFTIMLFLFFTPKFVNTEKKLIAYRCMSIIPVIVIIAFTIIFHGANNLFGWNLPPAALYFFASEKTPFSILCIVYLFGLYFLRLFFEKRYGTENAAKYFNGNRFIMLKNAWACIIVAIVTIFELIFRSNEIANIFGVGQCYYIGLLIPVLIFYHPHKGARNKAVDMFTMTAYMLAVSWVYIIIGLFGILLILRGTFML